MVAHVGALGVMDLQLQVEHVNVLCRVIHHRITASLPPKLVRLVRLVNTWPVVDVLRHLVKIGYAVQGHAKIYLQNH